QELLWLEMSTIASLRSLSYWVLALPPQVFFRPEGAEILWSYLNGTPPLVCPPFGLKDQQTSMKSKELLT
ncbi:MAG: hypothetical protein KGS49_19315, partial [Planctomycetes bacterium]|nr:hypothetical protein [Planctomycetota bacterium]